MYRAKIAKFWWADFGMRKKSCNARSNIQKKFLYLHRKKRKGAGVVDRAALEMR